MATTEINLPPQGRRRGRYSDEFKARLIEACRQPGTSTAAVALANGLNANLLRRWVTEADGDQVVERDEIAASASAMTATAQAFVQIGKSIPTRKAQAATSELVHIELLRGEVTIAVDWPLSHVTECAALLGTVLR